MEKFEQMKDEDFIRPGDELLEPEVLAMRIYNRRYYAQNSQKILAKRKSKMVENMSELLEKVKQRALEK